MILIDVVFRQFVGGETNFIRFFEFNTTSINYVFIYIYNIHAQCKLLAFRNVKNFFKVFTTEILKQLVKHLKQNFTRVN